MPCCLAKLTTPSGSGPMPAWKSTCARRRHQARPRRRGPTAPPAACRAAESTWFTAGLTWWAARGVIHPVHEACAGEVFATECVRMRVRDTTTGAAREPPQQRTFAVCSTAAIAWLQKLETPIA